MKVCRSRSSLCWKRLPALLAGFSAVTCFAEVSQYAPAAARRLISATGSKVFHFDLLARGTRSVDADERSSEVPWFDGFVESEDPTAATLGHPIRRMLLHLAEEAVDLAEALSWGRGSGKQADELTSFRQGYQVVDNYVVRVLAGREAWNLPPGGVGAPQLQEAQSKLGKFEVLVRAECQAVDLLLLLPYLSREVSQIEIAEAASETEDFLESEPTSLNLGAEAAFVLRANRWDLQKMLGTGKHAVVYNSPSYHATGVAMFSCILVSLNFEVTAVIKEPGQGFADLLPCPHKIVTLDGHYREDVPGEILDPEVSALLGLPPWGSSKERASRVGDHGERRLQGEAVDGTREDKAVDVGDELKIDLAETVAGDLPGGAGAEERRLFDLSVLCTAVNDVNHLLKPSYPVDPRLVEALLWNVESTIWNIHSVEGAFRHGGRVPSRAGDFARGLPSPKDGRMPPPTFLTLYGEHVEMWERWSEEVYEGWGWSNLDEDPSENADAVAGVDLPPRLGPDADPRGNSTLGGLFRRQGVVYPIHPTGHLRLLRPKLPPGHYTDSDNGIVTKFVVQGNMQSSRRDYTLLMRCLEAMCVSGKNGFELIAVGARGEMPNGEYPCSDARMKELRHLPFPDFYSNISAGHFVVTAAAGHDYEFDRATSTVPTALLLERPLVMSSALLDAYPCLKTSRVHAQIANDNLCLNLEAAYDLTPEEYNEMELEVRVCKLEMWKSARQTVASMASGWILD